jgi:hypothetical protein
VIWWAPSLGSAVPDLAYIFQYDIKAWYRYEGWSADCIAVDSVGRVYGGMRQGTDFFFAELHTSQSDNGDDITAIYETMPYDWNQPDITKTIPFVDLFLKNDTNLILFNYDFDFGENIGQEILQSSETGPIWGATADSPGDVRQWGPGSEALLGAWGMDVGTRMKRVDIYGIGKYLALTFKVIGQGATEILGWKTSPRMKGLR